ncbi:MAG: hypothetical protein JWR84_3394 [Caulobacter sp.]|nr:hypothetical protein [Caulobacter sp.]
MKRMLLAATLSLGLAAPSFAQAPPPVHLAPPQSLSPLAISLEQFTKGTLRFVMLHEMGHGLVDLYDLPVLGREEDAADRFATYWLSPDERGEDGVAAAGAMEWWLASARLSDSKREDLPWWDEHGMDEQRGFQIGCLLYGSAPEDFLPLAKRIGIPDRRLEGCLGEAHQNAASWSVLLRGNVAKVAGTPGLLVPIAYEKAGADTQAAAELVQTWGLLEELRDIMVQLRPGDDTAMVLISARDCGFSNAFWDPNEKSLTLCYELVNEIVSTGAAAGFKQPS